MSMLYREAIVTEAELIHLATLPRITPPRLWNVSWNKVCDYCPETIREQCHILNLAGLPLRCQRRDTNEPLMEIKRYDDK